VTVEGRRPAADDAEGGTGRTERQRGRSRADWPPVALPGRGPARLYQKCTPSPKEVGDERRISRFATGWEVDMRSSPRRPEWRAEKAPTASAVALLREAVSGLLLHGHDPEEECPHLKSSPNGSLTATPSNRQAERRSQHTVNLPHLVPLAPGPDAIRRHPEAGAPQHGAPKTVNNVLTVLNAEDRAELVPIDHMPATIRLLRCQSMASFTASMSMSGW
jgi:hypothetical protein